MGYKRSKYIQGIFAILIMMHHLSQKTSAFWVPAAVRQHGLEPFIPIGYLLVSFFFFCSGYGLIKSMRDDDTYFDGFLIRRLNRILLIFVLTQLIWFIVRFLKAAVYLPLNPYNWYIYAIIILYFGFFFFYRKETKASFLLMALWILVYSVICYIFVKGNWWYNATPAFLLGIYIADRELAKTKEGSEYDTSDSKNDSPKNIKSIILKALVPAIIFIITFILSENMGTINTVIKIPYYGIVNFIIVILQIIACSAFSLVIYIFASEIRTNKQNEEIKKASSKAEDNSTSEEGSEDDSEEEKEDKTIPQRILEFYGSVTLEFYLIHGLFVQMFGHHFMDDSTKPILYIKNVFLYVIVVFICATVSSFLLKKAAELIYEFYERSGVFQKICSDYLKYFIVIIGLLLTITICYSIYRHKKSADAVASIKQYEQEHIKYVKVNGTDLAVYEEGEGDYTLVLLGTEWDPCPTLYLRPLSNELADTYHVIIIDYPGKGFSKDVDQERTADFYADTIHETLVQLDSTENVILVPDIMSAIYCYRYIEKYPDSIAGMVGIDAAVPELSTRFLGGTFTNAQEYNWNIKRNLQVEGLYQKFMTLTGYVSLQVPIYEQIFGGNGLKEYYPAMEEMFIRNYLQPAHLKELEKVYDNCESVKGYKLPEDLPTCLILNDETSKNNYYGTNWKKAYEKLITNSDIQYIQTISGSSFSIYYSPRITAYTIDKFITILGE